MNNKFKSLISITDFTKDEIVKVLQITKEFEQNPDQKILENKVIGSAFFEPSTRTRLSFESAVNRLGGKIIGFSDSSNTSISKGESLKDTTLMLANYCDLIIMRHSLEGSVRFASEISKVPVINAGDGSNQHPTQTLLDLYSIEKTQGTLYDLKIAMVGDLKYGRTVHSLIMAMSHFNASFKFIAPKKLKLPEEYRSFLNNMGLSYEEYDDLTDNINDVDIIYMTRVQRERFSDPMEYEKVKNTYILRNNMLNNTKPTVKILHPLPRINEINIDVDSNTKAYYFEQALNGVYTRMAIISYILGLK